MTSKPTITLFHLENARSYRIAWLLEELNLPYNLVRGSRGSDLYGLKEFKSQIGSLGRVPTIHDEIKNGKTLIIQESGAIVEYLCKRYGKSNKESLIYPSIEEGEEKEEKEIFLHNKISEYIHMAEATYLAHAMPIYYLNVMFKPKSISEENDSTFVEANKAHEKRLIDRLIEDLEYFENELKKEKLKLKDGEKELYLVGKRLTAADIMMGQSILMSFGLGLGSKIDSTEEEKWKYTNQWIKGLQNREAWKKSRQGCASDS